MAQESAIQKTPGSEMIHPEGTRSGWHYRPNVDIVETTDELTMLVDMPGAQADGIEVNYEHGTLRLFGPARQRQGDNTNFMLREYGVGDYHRTFQVGESIEAGRISAEYKDGVLTVHLPKAESVKPRKITVQTQ